jgi:hypothetical protein
MKMPVNEIERVIGKPAYHRLGMAVGGCDYHIPSCSDCEIGAALIDTVGHEAAMRLIKWGGGSRVYIPYSRTGEVDQRRLTLREMRARGMTISEIARTFRFEGRYTERQIYALLAATE